MRSRFQISSAIVRLNSGIFRIFEQHFKLVANIMKFSDLSLTHISTTLVDSRQPEIGHQHRWSLNSSKIEIWAPNVIDQSSAKNGVFKEIKNWKNNIFILDNWLPVYSNTNTNGYSSIRRILIGYLIGLINVFIYLKWAIISGMWNRFIPERTRLSTVWMHRPKRGWPHVTSCDLSLIMSTANRVDQISIPHF